MVVTSDGRIIVGKLIGHDQVQNLILTDSHERVYSVKSNHDSDGGSSEVERVPTGLQVVRGDTVCLVGDFDEAKLDDHIQVPFSLPVIQQHQFL
jgi:U6 snRNA-associated Sm-like protein LSm8